MRSKCRCSMCPAIHINSRSWLRSSSTHEPSDPPPKVVFSFFLQFLRFPDKHDLREAAEPSQRFTNVSSFCVPRRKKGKKKDTRGAASAGLFKPSPRRTVDDMEALSSASPVGPAGSSRAGARHPHRTGTPVSHFFRVAGRPKPWRPSSQPRSRLPAVTDGPAVFWRGLRVAGRVRQHASPS